MEKVVKPKVKLIGEDGNVFFIIGKVSKALRPLGLDVEYRDKVLKAESYDHALQITSEYVEVC